MPSPADPIAPTFAEILCDGRTKMLLPPSATLRFEPGAGIVRCLKVPCFRSVWLLLSFGLVATVQLLPAQDTSEQPGLSVIGEYCLDCHDQDDSKGDLDLELLLDGDMGSHRESWEKVYRKLLTRQMPPGKEKNRPTEAEFVEIVRHLGGALDELAASQPNPGRTETFRRLNRSEYQNAVRDLLDLQIDAARLLPLDESSHGFDNVTVGTLSPVLLDRYITAARKISRIAVGGARPEPDGDTIRIAPDLTQEDRVEGLPFGTRGGAVLPYTFPRKGEYEIAIRLARDRNDQVEGLREKHTVLVLLDREEVKSFTVKPPGKGKGHEQVDAHLTFRATVDAGPRQLGVAFLKNPFSVLETKRQPYQAHFNYHRHPRIGPALFQVSITGPYVSTEPGNSPSRRRIFADYPEVPGDDEEARARTILSKLLRRAWRRVVFDEDVERLMPLFRQGQKETGFEAGIEAALSGILVSREFLFRVERQPENAVPGTPYPVGDTDLASRLSFFLWSSIPDDELLAHVERGDLRTPGVLEAQTRRMLADPRSEALVKNFAGQWLHLRNLESASPDGRLFPGFDDNLRQAFRIETELLFEETLREDTGILNLIKPDHTYLNERLAKHYGIPHVYGSHFRRVNLSPDSPRGGILRHGSILTVTSYATRTSPVIRGKWILENIIGTPPAPPAPDVPALDTNTVAATLPIRERLAAHRENPACAGCHEFIDPPGFALENFDAVGRWRTLDGERPVDATGGLPDGSVFNGPDGLEEGLVRRPRIFATALTEKLLTYALGRGVEHYDAAAVRKIVRRAESEGFRFSSIITGIADSVPFTHRMSQ